MGGPQGGDPCVAKRTALDVPPCVSDREEEGLLSQSVVR